MTAPVSPIATQETAVNAAVAVLLHATTPHQLGRDWRSGQQFFLTPEEKIIAAVPVVVEALSFAERRIEELKRERDEALSKLALADPIIYRRIEAANVLESRLASLTGQVEELTRARNGLRPTAWMRGWTTPGTVHGPAEYDVDLVYGDDPPEGTNWIPLYAGPAEARVQDMRTALAPFVQHYESWMDAYPDNHESSTFSRHTSGQLRAARAAIRSLPVLPTMGDGGGIRVLDAQERDAFGRALLRSVEVVGHLSPTGRETSGEDS